MLGIVAVNGYVPYYRLARAAIGDAWRLEQARDLLIGERAVASFDEDTITLAVEAALHTLEDRTTEAIGALYFASTTPVFLEKSNAAECHFGACPRIRCRAGGTHHAGAGGCG